MTRPHFPPTDESDYREIIRRLEALERSGGSATDITGGDAPVGTIAAYWGSSAPAGWLLCNGGSFSGTTYPALAAKLGGTTLPNLKGRVIVGVDADQSEFNTLGETGGSKTATAAHTHEHVHGHATFDPMHTHGDTGADGLHFHLGNIGNVGYNFDANHAHHDRPGYAAEAPLEDHREPGTAIPVNVDSAGSHAHSVGAADTGIEVAGADEETTGDSSASAAGGNLPPYMAISYIIKAG